jgi:hypothetical protein
MYHPICRQLINHLVFVYLSPSQRAAKNFHQNLSVNSPSNPMAVIVSVYPIARKECVALGCNCRDAVFGDQYVTVPLSAATPCNCGHPYWQHKGTYSPESHLQRGGMLAMGCGGYFPDVCYRDNQHAI